MNDEVPVAVTVVLVGAAVSLFCARGLSRQLRGRGTAKRDWRLAAFSSAGLFGGLVVVAFGGLYLDTLLFGRI